MDRVRGQVGRAQAGGLSLLLAVALLAAAGSGVETARRVAFAGAGLAYAVVADVPRASMSASDAGITRVLVGVAGPAFASPPRDPDVAHTAAVLVASGCLDLPPPMQLAV